MFGVAWSLNFILLGSTGRISVISGPINDEIGAMQRIHPYRRANITDAVVSTFSYFVPWHLWPIVMLSVIEPLAETYTFITPPAPSDFFLTTFYPAVIWVVMLIAVLTGWGRSFEGRHGERVVRWFANDIPPDARVESTYGTAGER
jgi:Na+/H+ antiporter NhaC